MEAITAVKKLAISKPGTIKLVNQSKTTFIKNAAIPKVTNEMGRATICNIGLINVLIMPKTIAVITIAIVVSKVNPGMR